MNIHDRIKLKNKVEIKTQPIKKPELNCEAVIELFYYPKSNTLYLQTINPSKQNIHIEFTKRIELKNNKAYLHEIYHTYITCLNSDTNYTATIFLNKKIMKEIKDYIKENVPKLILQQELIK